MSTAYAYASSGDAELVLEDITIDPIYPNKGELVTITANVYNAGLKNTDFFTSIITIGYFVDEQLLYVNNINNIEPGISNKIEISSPPIWKSESGIHDIKIIVDYHDTLNDQYDSPDNNSMEKTFFIEYPKQTKILLDASPQYYIQGNKMPTITMSLLDSDSNTPLSNQEIIFNLDDKNFTLITDKEGKLLFSSTIALHDPVTISAFFAGNGEYLSSNSSLILYQFLNGSTSYLIIKIQDLKNQHTFEDYLFEIIIFQDSYNNVFKKIQPNSTTLLDPETFWISLPPEHTLQKFIFLADFFL